jgi:hypothetical protein
MTHPLPSETIEYERYVDGLRRSNAELTEALTASNHLMEVATDTLLLPDAMAHKAIKRQQVKNRGVLANTNTVTTSPAAKAITIHVEGGMVADVTGIPAGYEVRVEDYDVQNPGDDSWDAEKGCAVTVYGGDGV